ncbi:ABC transporter ATP-binding protein [Levilactobacillus tujiorum]|uniref:ABC transporter ATP-binding protein n=1 Tax=Levilactobacillus tujiorum TaxID=2912243 RepID=A0ABX1L6K4_9LACO|nr:ABC transporter ATP-binding protein [Levilactobacillus tujiorum]MCH5463571.1 ABC transporter ATP-binding protein [Levilactobacillus tujiorum]NLR12147.1 ABC transporter ATP-binding protein [Lactobacillus sp. HBUAS51387]NLR30703.1 ABC transporter ATP-binding protein [Levilactobacillus tujiorum]
MTTKIVVNHVQQSFQKQAVLCDVSLEIGAGQIYALLGANGAGKTTLIRIMTGLRSPDAGTVVLDRYDLRTQLGQAQRCFSYNGQVASVDDVLTGFENLVLLARLRHVKHARQAATELLAQFRLSNAAKQRVATYSGGMRRRLDLAMSLVGDPEIIFLDEPTTGLDPTGRDDLWRVIRQLRQRGKTIFLTTQYLEEADQLADQIGFLRDGKIVATGTPMEMKRLAGSEKLILTFATSAARRQALEKLLGFSPQSDGDLNLKIEVASSVTTTLAVLSTLTQCDIQPIDFHLAAPTLDDVFRQLTKVG